ncbi:MAG TPA: glycoside hydrolase family 5 protein, partial [Sphingomonadaceae bacterium]|nr:glycoside hydrolase family 5 protein [Sphingomonadaceae bacterium]
INNTDFQQIAARGFETVRLPVRFSNHALTSAPYTIDAAFMDRVEQVVDLARAAGLRVILDLHHYEDPQGNIFTNPAGQTARLAGMWAQIAERFKEKDELVWFEILNEPHGQITHANLRSVLDPALAEIRKPNPNRPVVWGGEFWSGINSLDDIPIPPNDNRLVITFHYTIRSISLTRARRGSRRPHRRSAGPSRSAPISRTSRPMCRRRRIS